jgi:hypothetical protein
MAGALVLGTALVSSVLVALRPGTSTVALTAAQAFAVASLVAGALPTVRDRILVPLRWAGYVAALAVIALAAGTGSRLDPVSVVVALASLALTLGVALALRRDLFSALAATGTRDPIVAIALAWSVGGPDATAVPIAGAAILGIASAALVIRRR